MGTTTERGRQAFVNDVLCAAASEHFEPQRASAFDARENRSREAFRELSATGPQRLQHTFESS